MADPSAPGLGRLATIGASWAAFTAAALVFVIRVYRAVLSPLLGPSCRYHPSCSAYAMTAIDRYGPLSGSARALSRLARCHPFTDGGYDPAG